MIKRLGKAEDVDDPVAAPNDRRKPEAPSVTEVLCCKAADYSGDMRTILEENDIEPHVSATVTSGKLLSDRQITRSRLTSHVRA